MPLCFQDSRQNCPAPRRARTEKGGETPGEGAKEKGDDALQRGVGRDRWSDEAPWLPERR